MPLIWTAACTVEPAVDPGSIPDLELWLNPTTLTLLNDGDLIALWADSSGNSRNATASGANRPTYRASGGSNDSAYLEFDGTSDAMQLASFASGFTAGKVFVVAQQTRGNPPASLNGPILAAWGNSSGGSEAWPGTDSKIIDGFGSTVRKTSTSTTSVPSSWCLYEVLSKSGEWTSALNGTLFHTTATNTVGWSTSFGPSIGINPNLSRFKGGIAEIIFFSRDIDSSEIQAVRDYIALTYGLTIA